MSYAATCILIANVVCIPIMGVLLWQMGWRNLLKWLLIIPAIALTDLDHFLFTNVPGFRAHPAPGEKIFHFAHTIEFVILEIVFFYGSFYGMIPGGGELSKLGFFRFRQIIIIPFNTICPGRSGLSYGAPSCILLSI